MPITLQAPAKINLYLRVFARASDGFHPLRSWFRTIELFDELGASVPRAIGKEGARIQLSCSDKLLLGEGNLVERAFRELVDPGNLSIPLQLNKRIPVGAGLGGGSSDAAATLALVRKLMPQCPERDLAAAARDLGADVPFFLRHQIDGITDATCTGRGEQVAPFEPGRRHVVLLILPELHVSTAEVYRHFDELPGPPGDDGPDFQALSQLPAARLLPLLRNDLEPATFSLHPALAKLHARAQELVGRPVRMTGSGSALFCLYDDPAEAKEALVRTAPLNVRRLLA